MECVCKKLARWLADCYISQMVKLLIQPEPTPFDRGFERCIVTFIDILGYSESLDHELRNWGIRVSIIEPAYTRTKFDAHALEPDAARDEYHDIRAALAETLKAAITKGDEPNVVAEVVLKAAIAARPKLRYTAGGVAGRLWLLRRFAPAAVLDAGIRKDMKLDVLIASQARIPVLER